MFSAFTPPEGRPLLPRDETVRQAWAEQHRRALAGRRFEPPKPLATGADAKTLHQRAQAWAARRAAERRG